MRFYKLRHTVQILRYLNKYYNKFSPDSWHSVKNALAHIIIKEAQLTDKLKSIVIIQQLCSYLLANAKTVRSLMTFEAELQKQKRN